MQCETKTLYFFEQDQLDLRISLVSSGFRCGISSCNGRPSAIICSRIYKKKLALALAYYCSGADGPRKHGGMSCILAALCLSVYQEAVSVLNKNKQVRGASL